MIGQIPSHMQSGAVPPQRKRWFYFTFRLRITRPTGITPEADDWFVPGQICAQTFSQAEQLLRKTWDCKLWQAIPNTRKEIQCIN